MASNADVKKKAMPATATIAVDPAIANAEDRSPHTAGSIGRRARRHSSRLRYSRAQNCPGLQRKPRRAIRTACRLIEFAAAAEPASAGQEPANPPMTMLLTWVRLSPTV